MVKVLEVFREFFTGHENQFVLIGGTAATLAMEQAGLNFRATKDLDIVLHVEAIDAGFGARLWSFIERGGYEIRQASDSGKPGFVSVPETRRFLFPSNVGVVLPCAGGNAAGT